MKRTIIATLAALALAPAFALTPQEQAEIDRRYNMKRYIKRDLTTLPGYVLSTYIKRGVIGVETNKRDVVRGGMPTDPYTKRIVDLHDANTNLTHKLSLAEALAEARGKLLNAELAKLYEDKAECEANIVEFQEKYEAWKSIPVFGTGIALYFKTKRDRETAKLAVIEARIKQLEDFREFKGKVEDFIRGIGL